MQPSIARMVHYVSHGTPVRPDGTQEYTSQCRAATITELSYLDPELTRPTDEVGLCVLNPTGFFFRSDVPYSADHKPGSWHWPEEV